MYRYKTVYIKEPCGDPKSGRKRGRAEEAADSADPVILLQFDRLSEAVGRVSAAGHTDAGLVHGFTARSGGVSEGGCRSLNLSFRRENARTRVMENYRRAAYALDVPLDSITCVPQVHSSRVLHVTQALRGIGVARQTPDEILACGYDAMVTDTKGITLCTIHGDCVPVLFYDPVHKAVGLAHSGWRGTAERISRNVVRKMALCFGSAPEDLFVVIGPCIGMCCFEVGPEVCEAFFGAFGSLAEDPDYMRMRRCTEAGGKKDSEAASKGYISLERFIFATLTECGVCPEHIDVTGICTSCDPERWFSHRRDHGKTGAMAAFIGLR